MKKTITVMLLAILIHACASKSDVQITQLRCEYLDNPLGIDEVNPRLSWIIESVEGGQKQTAYQVMAASTMEKLNSKNPDLWDSGKVKSDQSIQIEYNGKPLTSRMDCYWKVKIWDKKSRPSAWSDPALWSMGLLEKTDWKAKWIGADTNKKNEEVKKDLSTSEKHIKIEQRGDPPIPPSPLLKKSFTIKKQIKKATVYATALGLYELRINGKKVGDYVLAPEWTDYNKRIQYQTFDVTGFLNQGENVIGATLADGWYMGFFAQWGSKTPNRGENYGSLDRKLLVQLEIVTTDDQTDTVITDETWQIWNDGPVRSADMFLGEVYDTRKEIIGWDMPEFDDSEWENASEFPATEAELVAQMNEPIRIVKELKPIAVTEPETGTYIFDMGQNMVGWCRLMVNEPEVTKIRLRHGEMLTMDGGIYVENLRRAKQEDIFITNGKGENTFEPRFTYHGFRYVEVTGLSKKPTPEMLTGMVVASDADLTGKFECSNSDLNQIWKNTLWSQRGNMHSTPTDCPQRDERMGWMGDAQVFSQTAIFNMNMAAFFSKWSQDIRDAQQEDGRYADFCPYPNNKREHLNSPGWADAGVIVPWRLYQNYADERILEKHYSSAKRFIDHVHLENPDLIWTQSVGNNYGDWLNGNTIISEDYPKTGGKVPDEIHATMFFAHSTRILANMAKIIGNDEDARKYTKLADEIWSVFNKNFVDSTGQIKGKTQAGYALALNFDLLPEKLRNEAAKWMTDAVHEYDIRISTGFQSTYRLMLELTRWGYNDIAYQLVESHRFPSWLYSIDQGATTIWERWDAYVKGRGFQSTGMNSFNHYSFGSVVEWMVKTILGINPDDEFPGFKKFIIHPQPGGSLEWAKGEYNSIHGKIESEWKTENGRFKLNISVPVNTTAKVYIPAKDPDLVMESNKPIKKSKSIQFLDFVNSEAVYVVPSGKYEFTVPYIR